MIFENMHLSKRELQIVQLLAEGQKSKDIAAALKISGLTVYTHRRNILKKLELGNSSQVVAWAYKNGLISFGNP